MQQPIVLLCFQLLGSCGGLSGDEGLANFTAYNEFANRTEDMSSLVAACRSPNRNNIMNKHYVTGVYVLKWPQAKIFPWST
jgi:hypothetical protein